MAMNFRLERWCAKGDGYHATGAHLSDMIVFVMHQTCGHPYPKCPPVIEEQLPDGTWVKVWPVDPEETKPKRKKKEA